MGVPAFFRWLTDKYKKVVTDVKESEPIEVNGELIYPEQFDSCMHISPEEKRKEEERCSARLANNDSFLIHNLYLDMNGIIHPCCHPEDEAAPLNEDEMIAKIFRYIDRIVYMVKPTRILYMAIDGVAPRAKMNQQRSRRFRAAKEAADKARVEEEIRAEWAALGRPLPASRAAPWDSNVITPGTPFMWRLSKALQGYIVHRLNSPSSSPGSFSWKGLTVIFSDAQVPGEGEHKIMKFIRNQRAQSGYDPNTSHCLYGMDADLIMLGLASHDPHFKIIREQVTSTYKRRCDLCGQEGHIMSECTTDTTVASSSSSSSSAAASSDTAGLFGQRKPFQFLHLNVLREYLQHDLYIADLPFAWDFERVIDDFILLAITVGNDFLPHLPSLEIREKALERLMTLYKRELPALGGYLSENGVISMTRLDIFFSALAEVEDSILKERRRQERMQKTRQEERQRRIDNERARRAAITATALQHDNMVAVGGDKARNDKAEDMAEEDMEEDAEASAAKAEQEAQTVEADDEEETNKMIAAPQPPSTKKQKTAKKTKRVAAEEESQDATEEKERDDTKMRSTRTLVDKKKKKKQKKSKQETTDEEADATDEAAEASKLNISVQFVDVDALAARNKKTKKGKKKSSMKAEEGDDEPEMKMQPLSPASSASSPPPASSLSSSAVAEEAGSKRKRKRVKMEEDSVAFSSSSSSPPHSSANLEADQADLEHSAKPLSIEAALAEAEEDEEEEEDVTTATPSPLKDARHLTSRILQSHQPIPDIPSEDFAAILNARLSALAEPKKQMQKKPKKKRMTRVQRKTISENGDVEYYEEEVEEEGTGNDDPADEQEGEEEVDEVRFGEEGWKSRYYSVKMHLNVEEEADLPLLKRLISSYAQGLSWVMLYYYSGCVDWSWFYPFHYAPFASELRHLDEFDLSFKQGTAPFAPVAQLMGVLPAASAHAVPASCRRLMCDPDSPLNDFYPLDFPLDLNGKRYLWQAVALLPWIDERRLLKELANVESTFTAEERARNSIGEDFVFVDKTQVHLTNWLVAQHLRFVAPFVKAPTKSSKNVTEKVGAHELSSKKQKKVEEDLTLSSARRHGGFTNEAVRSQVAAKLAPLSKALMGFSKDGTIGGLFGFIAPYPEEIAPGALIEITGLNEGSFSNQHVYSAHYRLAPEKPHVSRLLPGLQPPAPVLNERDLRERREAPRGGPRFGEAATFLLPNNQDSLYYPASNAGEQHNPLWNYAPSNSSSNFYAAQQHSYATQSSPYASSSIDPYGSSGAAFRAAANSSSASFARSSQATAPYQADPYQRSTPLPPMPMHMSSSSWMHNYTAYPQQSQQQPPFNPYGFAPDFSYGAQQYSPFVAQQQQHDAMMYMPQQRQQGAYQQPHAFSSYTATPTPYNSYPSPPPAPYTFSRAPPVSQNSYQVLGQFGHEQRNHSSRS